MTTLLLTAVHGARVETGVAQPEKGLQVGFRVKKFSQPADHLVAVVLLSEQAERRLDDAASQPLKDCQPLSQLQ